MATAAGSSNLFRHYIGALYNGVRFADVPVDPRVRFDNILAFVIDYTTATGPPFLSVSGTYQALANVRTTKLHQAI
jgi:hypothetical protein